MEMIAGAKNLEDESVLFITSQLRQREIKMAYALKSLGWRVDLIYYNSTPFKPEGFFDFIQEVKSAKEAYKHAQLLAPRLIHIFSGAIDDYVMLFCKNKVAPIVIDLNDIFTPALMDYCSERFEPTRKVLSLADGFCARDLQVKRAEQLDSYQLPPQLLFFPEYCWNNKALNKEKTSQELHIVSVGTISLETHGMFDCCYLKLVNYIIKHGIHFHLYPPWSYRKDYKLNLNFEKDYAQFLALERNNSYVHIHESLPVDKLADELPQYDFGIISGGCKEFGQKFSHFKPIYVESCYSGRISDYLDANLPILINEEVAFNYRLLKRYGVSVDLKKIIQSGFKSELQAFKQDGYVQNKLEKARTRLSIISNAPRLAKFYSNIINSSAFPNANNAVNHTSLFKKLKNIITLGMKTFSD